MFAKGRYHACKFCVFFYCFFYGFFCAFLSRSQTCKHVSRGIGSHPTRDRWLGHPVPVPQVVPWGDKESLAMWQRRLDVDVLVHGGTHQYGVFEAEGKFFVNPGPMPPLPRRVE